MADREEPIDPDLVVTEGELIATIVISILIVILLIVQIILLIYCCCRKRCASKCPCCFKNKVPESGERYGDTSDPRGDRVSRRSDEEILIRETFVTEDREKPVVDSVPQFTPHYDEDFRKKKKKKKKDGTDDDKDPDEDKERGVRGDPELARTLEEKLHPGHEAGEQPKVQDGPPDTDPRGNETKEPKDDKDKDGKETEYPRGRQFDDTRGGENTDVVPLIPDQPTDEDQGEKTRDDKETERDKDKSREDDQNRCHKHVLPGQITGEDVPFNTPDDVIRGQGQKLRRPVSEYDDTLPSNLPRFSLPPIGVVGTYEDNEDAFDKKDLIINTDEDLGFSEGSRQTGSDADDPNGSTSSNDPHGGGSGPGPGTGGRSKPRDGKTKKGKNGGKRGSNGKPSNDQNRDGIRTEPNQRDKKGTKGKDPNSKQHDGGVKSPSDSGKKKKGEGSDSNGYDDDGSKKKGRSKFDPTDSAPGGKHGTNQEGTHDPDSKASTSKGLPNDNQEQDSEGVPKSLFHRLRVPNDDGDSGIYDGGSNASDPKRRRPKPWEYYIEDDAMSIGSDGCKYWPDYAGRFRGMDQWESDDPDKNEDMVIEDADFDEDNKLIRSLVPGDPIPWQELDDSLNLPGPSDGEDLDTNSNGSDRGTGQGSDKTKRKGKTGRPSHSLPGTNDEGSVSHEGAKGKGHGRGKTKCKGKSVKPAENNQDGVGDNDGGTGGRKKKQPTLRLGRGLSDGALIDDDRTPLGKQKGSGKRKQRPSKDNEGNSDKDDENRDDKNDDGTESDMTTLEETNPTSLKKRGSRRGTSPSKTRNKRGRSGSKDPSTIGDENGDQNQPQSDSPKPLSKRSTHRGNGSPNRSSETTTPSNNPTSLKKRKSRGDQNAANLKDAEDCLSDEDSLEEQQGRADGVSPMEKGPHASRPSTRGNVARKGKQRGTGSGTGIGSGAGNGTGVGNETGSGSGSGTGNRNGTGAGARTGTEDSTLVGPVKKLRKRKDKKGKEGKNKDRSQRKTSNEFWDKVGEEGYGLDMIFLESDDDYR